jgi:hypothetical protein
MEKLCLGNDDNPITFLVFDDDDSKKKGDNDKKKQYIGEVVVPLRKMKTGASFPIINPKKPTDKCGTLYVDELVIGKKDEKESSKSSDKDKERSSSSSKPSSSSAASSSSSSSALKYPLSLRLGATDLKKMDLLSQSDGFVEVVNASTGKVLYVTEVLEDKKDPRWAPFVLAPESLAPAPGLLTFRVYDDDSGVKQGAQSRKRELIGECTISAEDLLKAGSRHTLPLVNKNAKDTKLGALIFESVSSVKERSGADDPYSQGERRRGPSVLDMPYFPDTLELDWETWDALRASSSYQVRVALRQHADAQEAVERLTRYLDKLDSMLDRRLVREAELAQRIREQRFEEDYPPSGMSSWGSSPAREEAVRRVREAAFVREAAVMPRRDLSPRSAAGWRSLRDIQEERAADLDAAGDEWGREYPVPPARYPIVRPPIFLGPATTILGPTTTIRYL